MVVWLVQDDFPVCFFVQKRRGCLTVVFSFGASRSFPGISSTHRRKLDTHTHTNGGESIMSKTELEKIKIRYKTSRFYIPHKPSTQTF